MTQARVPQGNPSGGRFAAAAHAEPAVILTDHPGGSGDPGVQPPLPDPDSTMFDNVAETNASFRAAYKAGDHAEVQRLACERAASAIRNSPAYMPGAPPVAARLEKGEDGRLHATAALDAFEDPMEIDGNDVAIVDAYAAHLKPGTPGFTRYVAMVPHSATYRLELDKALGTPIW